MSLNDKIMLWHIKNALKQRDVKKITKIVNSGKYNEDILSDDIIVQMIEAGYTVSEGMPQKIRSSSKYLNLMFNSKGCRKDLIDFFDESLLTPKIIEKSIRRGYQLSSKSSKIISENLEYVTMILFEFLPKEYTGDVFDNLPEVVDNLKYCSKSIVSDAIISFYAQSEKFGCRYMEKGLGLPLILNEIDVNGDILKHIITKFVEEYGIDFLVDIISNIEEKKLSEDLIEYVGSKITYFSELPTVIKQNLKYIRALIKNEKIELRYFLRDLDISSLNEKDIDELFKRKMNISFFDNRDLYDVLRRCKKENFELVNWNKYISWIEPKYFDSLFGWQCDSNKFLQEKGIDINLETKEQQQFVLDLLRNANDSKLAAYILNWCKPRIMDEIKEEVYDIFKERNMLYSSDFSNTILDNFEYLQTLIIESTNPDVIKSVVDNINIKFLTDELINKAIGNGYYMSYETPEIIKSNLNYVYKMLNYGKSIRAVLSVINYIDSSMLTEEIIDVALDKGYYLTAETPSIIRNNIKYMKKLVNNMKKNNIVIDVNFYDRDNFVNPFKIKEKVTLEYGGYNVLEKDVVPISDFEIDEIIKNDFNYCDDDYKDKLKNIFRVIRNVVGVYYEIDNLFLKEMFEFYDENEILKMYKYLFLINKRIDFATILKTGQMEQFKAGYKAIYGNFDIEDLYEYYQKYLKNQKLICSINFDNISKEKVLLLKKVFLSKYSDINFKEVNLDEYSQLVYNRNKDNMYDIDSVRNTICLLLFNNQYNDLKDFYKNVLSYNKVLSLISSIKNEKIKYVLKKYAVFLRFFEEKIYDNNDYIELKNMAMKLNELFLENNEIYNYIYELFDNMKKNALTLYGIELNEHLGKLDDINDSKDVVYSKGKYVASNEKLNVDSVAVDMVDYYEETYFLQHIMNYNSNLWKETDITVWKNPILIGKAYICLSLFDNNTEQWEQNSNHINYVTLLFNRVVPKNLRIIGNSDLTTYAKNNSTDLGQLTPSEFMSFRDILASMSSSGLSHTEYVVLRENEDGSIIYPCGVKVVGDKPTQAEIDVAAYLGVPLIKVHKILKKTNDQVVEINENVSELYEMSKNVEVEQLEELIEYLSGENSKFMR